MTGERRRGISTAAVRRLRSPCAQRLQTRQNSNFIKRVMEQVKADMDKNENLKKAREDFASSGASDAREKLRQEALKQEERMSRWKEQISSKTDSTKNMFAKMREQAELEKQKLAEKIGATKKEEDASSPSEPSAFGQALDYVRTGTSTVTKSVRIGGGRMLDGIKSISSVLDVKEGQTRHEAWIAERDRQRAERELREKEAEELAARADKAEESAQKEASASAEQQQSPPSNDGGALVIRHSSTWDRFGANVRDMPFLNNILDNPMLESLMGETEMAQSLREMKEIDPGFKFGEFQEEVETVIAPRVVDSFLKGDRETLKLQCAGPAFAAVESSIKQREKLKCYLDTDILLGPTEVSCIAAKTMDESAPSFVFTFQTQQVNCLRNKITHDVIEGAVDDIRTVFYAIALTRHPALDEDEDVAMNLEYPWQIRELAIVGNQSSW